MDLANASAIVTGGAGGFGSATVRRLAQKGAKVVIADVSDERGEALAREVGSLYVSTDCMDEDAIAKAVQGGHRPRAAARRRDHPHRPGLARTGPAAAGSPGCWTPTEFDTPWPSSHTSSTCISTPPSP
jgi:NAD(P)-dependent dehydrogenase (short-subunit alcohol dehydrogenase family)